MEVVSFTRTAPAPEPKSLAITPEALASVQRLGAAEYVNAVKALSRFGEVIDNSVLFKDIADKLGEDLSKLLNSRLNLLDPAMSASFSPEAQITAKGAQRKLFLDYAKKYHLEGIQEE